MERKRERYYPPRLAGVSFFSVDNSSSMAEREQGGERTQEEVLEMPVSACAVGSNDLR